MSKATTYKCDARDCSASTDKWPTDKWKAVSVAFLNIRDEPIKKELHYCDKHWLRFAAFMNRESE